MLAGPIEATALGNVAVQARTAGLLPADLDQLRRRLSGQPLQTYRPADAAQPVPAR